MAMVSIQASSSASAVNFLKGEARKAHTCHFYCRRNHILGTGQRDEAAGAEAIRYGAGGPDE